MREIKYEGKTAVLTERDYTQLLKRFDKKRAVKRDETWKISIACPFCKQYFNVEELSSFIQCKGCPLCVFRTTDIGYGCIRLIHEVIGELAILPVITRDWIFWNDKYNKKAQLAMDKVHRKLLALHKVTYKGKSV